jgi:hypothetical protein
MATRPYIQKTVVELSALFDKCQGDADGLHKLLEELKNRSTPTAKRLRAKVETALKERESSDAVQGEKSKASEKEGDPNPRLLKCKACATTLRIPVRSGRNSYACPKCGQAFETRLEEDLLDVVFTLDNESTSAELPPAEMTVESACEFLGLNWPKSLEEIKKAWRLLNQEYHPDRHQQLPDRLKKAADEEVKRINIAYRFLENELNK